MCLPVLVITIRGGIRFVRLSGFDLHVRDQWEAEITHVPQQAVQRGLIDDRASEDVVPSLAWLRLRPSAELA
jgi:hypothetical protein